MRVKSDRPLTADTVRAVVGAAEARLADTGRVVIRKSGTEPLIRVMAEGEDEGLVAAVVAEICATISAADSAEPDIAARAAE